MGNPPGGVLVQKGHRENGGGPLGWRALLKGIYPINTTVIRCIWCWFWRVPSQGYHWVPPFSLWKEHPLWFGWSTVASCSPGKKHEKTTNQTSDVGWLNKTLMVPLSSTATWSHEPVASLLNKTPWVFQLWDSEQETWVFNNFRQKGPDLP